MHKDAANDDRGPNVISWLKASERERGSVIAELAASSSGYLPTTA
jgi:hypothetical protein